MRLAFPPTVPGGILTRMFDEEGFNVDAIAANSESHSVPVRIVITADDSIPPDHQTNNEDQITICQGGRAIVKSEPKQVMQPESKISIKS